MAVALVIERGTHMLSRRASSPRPRSFRRAAARAGARPHLDAVASIVAQEDLWQLRRDEFTRIDIRIDG
jgi:hypothetical protein